MSTEEKIDEVYHCLMQNYKKNVKCLIIVNNKTRQYECLE